MKQLPELLPTRIIERANRLSTSLISDAMDGTGTMDYSIGPVTNTKTVIGTALTVDLKAGDNLFLHEAIHMAQQGYVIVVNGKKHTKNAYLGELMSLAARARRVNGIIIDGLVRDKEFLDRMNFPVFARGFVPTGPFKDGPGQLNISISCGDVVVNPGDLIMGDLDGVVVIPKEKVDQVVTDAELKLNYETNRVQSILEYEKNSDQTYSTDSSIKPSWLDEKIKSFNRN